MGSQRSVIRNGFVVSMDPAIGEIPHADVFVQDGVIVEIGRDLVVADAEEIDAAGMIVMPGFIDTHRHVWQTTVRGLLPCCRADEYAMTIIGNVSGHFRAEDVAAGNLAGALEALNAGTTTMLDWSHISLTPEHSDAAVEALKSSGIRAVFGHGAPGRPEWWMNSSANHPEDILRLRETWFSSDDGLLTLAMAARAPGAATPEVAKHDWELARELGIRISVHVGTGAEVRAAGTHAPQIQELHRLGLLGPDTTYIHGTDLSDEDLDLIASSGGSVSISSYVEMVVGLGYPATGRLLEKGIRPSLSVDIVSTAPGEMFTQMRTVLAAERIRGFSPESDVPFLPTLSDRDVLDFATVQGARALGLGDKVGSLTVGKQADIVLLNARAINLSPVIDPVGSIVSFADTSNVDSVFVAGRAVKRGGKLVNVDLDSVFGNLESSRDHVLAASGLTPEWLAETQQQH